MLSDKVDSFEINRTLEVSVDEYAKFAAKLARKGKFDIADDFKKIMKFLKTADVSKIETLNLSDKNIELSASDIERHANHAKAKRARAKRGRFKAAKGLCGAVFWRRQCQKTDRRARRRRFRA